MSRRQLLHSLEVGGQTLAAFPLALSEGAGLLVADRRFLGMNPGLLELFAYMRKNGCIHFLLRGELLLAANAAAIEGQAWQQAHPRAAWDAYEMLESTVAGAGKHDHLVGRTVDDPTTHIAGHPRNPGLCRTFFTVGVKI